MGHGDGGRGGIMARRESGLSAPKHKVAPLASMVSITLFYAHYGVEIRFWEGKDFNVMSPREPPPLPPPRIPLT